MKIKLFYQKGRQSLEEFENQVNDFIAGVEVVDVKYSEATYGNYEDMSATAGLLVIYR